MVKVCQAEFPKGCRPRQQSDGFFMDGYLKSNLDILCKNIVNDMDFCIIISGSGMVRVGKSVFAQQVAKYLVEKSNELHKWNNTFEINDIIFEGEELIERALTKQKGSCLIYDEAGDEINTKAVWSKMMKYLQRFFRKCGQLNLFFILVIPDFFDLPVHFAISRSHILLNVYFSGEFDRGYFGFYNTASKNELKFKGQKLHNYKIVKPEFYGRFTDFYVVDEEEYRKKKRQDVSRINRKENSYAEERTLNKNERMKYLKRVLEGGIKIKNKDLGLLFDCSSRTIEGDKTAIREQVMEEKGIELPYRGKSLGIIPSRNTDLVSNTYPKVTTSPEVESGEKTKIN